MEAVIGVLRAAFAAWLGWHAEWLRRSGRHVVIDGQTLDARTQAFLLRMSGPGGQPSLERARLLYSRGLKLFGAALARNVVTREFVVDDEPALPARLYVPAGAGPTLLVYFHGGGWLMGGLETHDRLCRHLAARARTRVLSVAYRLAPEHVFPAAFDDAARAFRWARRSAGRLGVMADDVAIGGDSAGGNLAAAVAAAEARADAPGPSAVFLLYPALDLASEPASATLFGEGFVLTRAIAEACVLNYTPDAGTRADPRASPLRAPPAALGRLGPNLVITAGFDPLRDQGRDWAAALRAAGAHVTLINEAAMIHGFADFAGIIPEASAALDRAGDALATILRGAAAPAARAA